MNNEQYKEEFLEANERAKRLGYAREVISIVEQESMLTGDNLKSIFGSIEEIMTSKNPKDVAGNCLPVNMLLHKYMEEELNIKSYFTLGYIKKDNETVFKFSEQDLKNWIEHGIPDPLNINMHAWLTFQSLEILDITLATSIALSCDNLDFLGVVLHGFPEDVCKATLNTSFHPVFIGESILFDIGLPMITKIDNAILIS
jgi:hypothetical protein